VVPAVEITDSLTIGELAVGAGTALLALFTAHLGIETRKSAKAAREAVEASEEPFVIATPTPFDKMDLRPGKVPPNPIRPS
jgi:hypothetical protein